MTETKQDARARQGASRRRRGRLSLIVMWGVTAIYVVGAARLAISASDPIWTLSLSEIGDFAAGAAAPLAFLWLVYTAHLQRRELQLQIAELSNLVENARLQADALASQAMVMERDHTERRLDRLGERTPQITTVFSGWAREGAPYGGPVTWRAEISVARLRRPIRLLAIRPSVDVRTETLKIQGPMLIEGASFLIWTVVLSAKDPFEVSFDLRDDDQVLWRQTSRWDGHEWIDGVPQPIASPPRE